MDASSPTDKVQTWLGRFDEALKGRDTDALAGPELPTVQISNPTWRRCSRRLRARPTSSPSSTSILPPSAGSARCGDTGSSLSTSTGSASRGRCRTSTAITASGGGGRFSKHAFRDLPTVALGSDAARRTLLSLGNDLRLFLIGMWETPTALYPNADTHRAPGEALPRPAGARMSVRSSNSPQARTCARYRPEWTLLMPELAGIAPHDGACRDASGNGRSISLRFTVTRR